MTSDIEDLKKYYNFGARRQNTSDNAAATGFLQTMLYGVEAADPWSLAAASVVMATAALLAGFLPARRAAALDPLTTMREV